MVDENTLYGKYNDKPLVDELKKMKNVVKTIPVKRNGIKVGIATLNYETNKMDIKIRSPCLVNFVLDEHGYKNGEYRNLGICIKCNNENTWISHSTGCCALCDDEIYSSLKNNELHVSFTIFNETGSEIVIKDDDS